MYPLDVTMPQAGCCVAGGLEFGAGIDPRIDTVRGHRPASGVRPVRVPPIQTCYRTPGAKRVWNCASSGGRAHVRFESSYHASCHGEAASLVIGCAVDPQLSCGLLYLSFDC